MWQAVVRAIEEHEQILLTTHRDPDADGVGSELALHHLLRRMGKRPVILNPDPLPDVLRFLDPEGVVQGFPELPRAQVRELIAQAGAIFFLDFGVWKRVIPLAEDLLPHVDRVLCIDHHPAEAPLTPGSVIREQASSTGEMICDLARELGQPLDERSAYCLYCAITKDTGGFRFENTTPRVFELAAELTRFGIKPHEVYDQLFERSSINSVVCLGKVMETLTFAYDNRLAYIYLTRELLRRTGTRIEETENFANLVRSIDPVEASLFFRESEGDQIKVSFRSKSARIDVNELARRFGGGGHRRAAGALIAGGLHEVIDRVVRGAADIFQ